MVAITLPDGSVREFDGPVTGLEIAAAIGPRLAKDALAIKVGPDLKDLSTEVDRDASVAIVTRGHDDAMALLRHDCAHVMAEAVQELYPDTQVTFGPAIEDGFFYDFARADTVTRVTIPGDLAFDSAGVYAVGVAGMNKADSDTFVDMNTALSSVMAGKLRFKAMVIQ